MNSTRRRLVAVMGATLALAVAGTAVVSANGPWGQEDGGRGMFGSGRGPIRERMAEHFGGGLRGVGMDALVRVEATLDMGEDGIVVHRTERGVVTEVGDASLTYTLATGETGTVATDDSTVVLALNDSTAFRMRGRFDQVELADISVGTTVMVRSQGQADGTFRAGHVVVLPEAEATAAADDAAEDGSDS